MAGHSKWANIKHRKAAMDAKRGQLFSRLTRELIVAAREGGPDPETNLRLRLAIERARAANMPKENIERAIRRGAGLEKGAEQFEELLYEGYGPHGVAIIVRVLTDNRNRTVAELRRIFSRHGGSLAESGAVMWNFEKKGYIAIRPDGQDPERIFELAIEAGAEDVEISEDLVEIYTAPEDLQAVRQSLLQAGLTIDNAELTMRPRTRVTLDDHATTSVMSLVDALEELDDVQQVYSNLEISDELIRKYEAQAA
ncbi:YebC/PmpR family DNA-binding transcriptional regulator [Thermoflexus sp.]|uniref:YebC/PmpR family DNA-binding transcriptional regulator n=1 Tax=Thermoflexus sp. TaxID=1969742 RepID=UPI0025D14F61|nr:YebC/PmpR family DNA-binding transcriptional regulator [Thermoflexus sp.]MDW8065773.1 YebC/PmpR family DNA-binding transcriptional regulator [Anaerolineae bacterium]MCS6963860.1 YebC/PmpR family DNA-binding transcriptional regulator [Thermoflexus sp.]MCS7350242.1 YebC/PmpR family DNA-binding transcriptional regulator [Thermoflexus sp.]MCX7691443.1 YebC/PmpR family DNA-binding transcriptional regulator [Thermoflexus sp.]MDW8179693.1 YebC/PmpR family DNA-binding transcriptional regulator [Ana